MNPRSGMRRRRSGWSRRCVPGFGKVPGSRLIALGTRASDEQHWFSRALGFARRIRRFTPRRRTRRRFGSRRSGGLIRLSITFRALKARILAEIVDARRDPDALASFKALRLNQGVADTDRAVLIDSAAWSDAEALEGRRSGPFVLGVDLGQNAAMSAAAAYWKGGDLEAVAVFPEVPGLAERGLSRRRGRVVCEDGRRAGSCSRRGGACLISRV